MDNTDSQQSQQISDVERYWDKIAAAFGDQRKWQDLTPQQQQAMLQAINIQLAVLHRII